MLAKCPGVYAIRHAESGRVYVGSSVNLRARVRRHVLLLRHGRHWNGHLQSAWMAYGESAFEISVLEQCARDELAGRETFWIAEQHAMTPSGFNMVPVSGTIRGFRHPPSFGKAIRARKRGQKAHPNSQAALLSYNTGLKQPAAQVAKRAKALRRYSDETVSAWIACAVAGETTSSIAKRWGVPNRSVSKYTQAHSLHKKAPKISAWQLRQARIMLTFGRSVRDISALTGAQPCTIYRHLSGMVGNMGLLKAARLANRVSACQ